MALPYASATSGIKARGEIVKILKHFGCESVGFMDEFENKSILLAFVWNGKQIQLRASAQGWANSFLRENPWNYRRQSTEEEWEDKALEQGLIAVNSVLRDWIKGQVTAVETGILHFEHIFMPYMIAADGRPLVEHMKPLMIEAPKE